MNKPNRKAPELRFKGFTDDWEQRKLGDMVNVNSGRDYKHLSEGDIPVYGTGGYMLSVDDALSFDKDGIGIGRKGTIDKPYLLKAPFWTVDTLFYAIPKEEHVLDFVYLVFQKINWKRFDESTGVPSLSKKTIISVSAEIPKNKEQQKIGSFFKQLDNFITLHQRKLKKIRHLKEAFLQTMFPSKGNIVPKVRFTNFFKAWEQRKLENSGDFIRTSINPQETPKDSFIEYSMSAYDNRQTPEIVLGESMQSSRLKISGDVVLINKLNVRRKRIWLVQDAPKNAVASSEFIPYRSEDINLVFLQQLMISSRTTRDLESISSGTSNSQKRITPADFLRYQVIIPNDKEEQSKIGLFLGQLDKLIIDLQQKLDHLNMLKKAYLQKIFI